MCNKPQDWHKLNSKTFPRDIEEEMNKKRVRVLLGFPGSALVKNLSANAEDTV